MGRCFHITLITLITLSLLFALLLLVAFPVAIYPSVLKSKISIKTDDDGQLTKSGFYWSEPPTDNNYDYYFFDISNPDDVAIFGKAPIVNERGPYRWKEQDTRRSIKFEDDKTNVAYQTEKRYTFAKNESCGSCEYNDIITLPNLSISTMMRLLFVNRLKLTKVQVVLADITTLLLGVYPFSRVKMSEVLYVGYTDALLDFLHSKFKKDLDDIFGNPFGFDPPDIPLLGYFAAYNGTTDGEYVAHTGTFDYKKAGLIQSWRNTSSLDFWGTNETNNIFEATDGALSGSFLTKDTTLRLFQSFMCRHFFLNYEEEEEIRGVKSYKFTFDENNFNPYSPKFEGYIFENDENITYFDWKPNSTDIPDNVKLPPVPLPPGLFQQICVPGKPDRLPFVAMLSLPHFLNAPQEVQDSIKGLHPNRELHALGEFNIQPSLGATLRANMRTQLSIAMHQNPNLTSMSHSADILYPSFWLHVTVQLHDYAYDFFKLTTVTIPNIVFYVGIGAATLFLGCLVLLIVSMSCNYPGKNSTRL